VPARWAVAAAAFGLLLAVPVVTWWLVGDLSTMQVSDRDYAFKPWPIDPSVARGAAARGAGCGRGSSGGAGVGDHRAGAGYPVVGGSWYRWWQQVSSPGQGGG
jgi:hypothetical protein